MPETVRASDIEAVNAELPPQLAQSLRSATTEAMLQFISRRVATQAVFGGARDAEPKRAD